MLTVILFKFSTTTIQGKLTEVRDWMWCRKTLQHGYDRQQGIDRWMGQKLNGLDPWQHTSEQDAEVKEDMYACGFLTPHYPVPALRRDIVYWSCGGISINVVGACEPSYVFGRAFGNGVRLNYWEP